MAKTISEAIMSFTGKLGMHSSNLSRIAEETQITTGEKLYELEKEFEVLAYILPNNLFQSQTAKLPISVEGNNK